MRNTVIGIYVLAATAFLVLLGFKPYEGSYILKIVPILAMAYFVLRSASRNDARLVGIGLLFSSVGDVLLDVDRSGLFVYGLGAFLVAHIFYAVAFAQHRRKKLGARALPIVLLLTVSATLLYLMFPGLGDLKIPVIAYVAIINIMGVFALMRNSSDWMVPLGAILFVASDSVIAINKFGIAEVPMASLVIMITYYMAQFLIGLGVLRKS